MTGLEVFWGVASSYAGYIVLGVIVGLIVSAINWVRE